MSAVLAEPALHPRPESAPAIAVVLLGTGVVGGALLKLLNTSSASALRLVGAANSRRQQTEPTRLAQRNLREQLNQHGAPRDDAGLLAALDASGAPVRVIIDATASATLATRHAEWLAQGYHVVTANKALAGGELSGWRALQTALAQGGRYGDSATVGAGLPVLSTLRRLRHCGDALLTLEGVFSGSLSWLFNQYDGSRPFSELLREARQLGYTEPDPRSDLSGEDVARKLLIIARNAGYALGTDEVQVEGLVPPSLCALDTEAFMARLDELDAALATRCAEASSHGCVLRFLARLNQRGQARVGLTEVPLTHPAARLYGTDNQFALTTTRYNTQPLVIQGPGAGPEVTAQALLGDVLALG
ncbi:homoserine dehydrogenase [Rhodanobacter sp. Root561]|uniref:homoserine dehydrogenase n=1 Tax=Rhodanobacter sp. Root561 TaxID=1736560 RepID=UPI0006FCBCC8|nr:homoserine dehydrogenase [Rhodanobacter sp. Root561]KQZ71166.1 homoserine dehydrogenase [Rhodanobacter sp. Root561]